MDRLAVQIQRDIEAIERDHSLLADDSYDRRAEAIDFLDAHVIDRIDALLDKGGVRQELEALKRRAELAKGRLEEANESLCVWLRQEIRSGRCRGSDLKRWLAQNVKGNARGKTGAAVGYDSLDAFISGLMRADIVPETTLEMESEMVFYQPTPARVVLDLIGAAEIRVDDVFYDLGSGLGHVPILVNLLTGARAVGIEREPAYCAYASESARRLNLRRIEFINSDAREADYTDGTVFFMYTPFTGALMREVLRRLEWESRTRLIRVCAYGPCEREVSEESWLQADPRGPSEDGLVVFRSTSIASQIKAQ